MKLTKVKWEGKITAAICTEEAIRPIPNYSLMALIRRSEVEKVPLAELAASLASAHPVEVPLILPLTPREVWACGCTYQVSLPFRDRDAGPRAELYHEAYRAPRPQIFFKGTARVCVGPGQPVGIRADSTFTVPEPELAVVLGTHGRILGYTLANDVSAWDIERENPLYLCQSKIYDAACALGPVIVTPEELTDPYNLDLSCRILRGGKTVFSGQVNTSKLNRKIETLVEYLLRSNSVPRGSVLLTGTGITLPPEAALQPGDVTVVAVPEIGELRNPVVRH